MPVMNDHIAKPIDVHRNYKIPEGCSATDRPWYQEASASDGDVKLFYADAATGEWLFSQGMGRMEGQSGKAAGLIRKSRHFLRNCLLNKNVLRPIMISPKMAHAI